MNKYGPFPAASWTLYRFGENYEQELVGGGKDEHKIHWMEWRKLAIPKKLGGLGFRSLHEFNIAMLGKQGWRLLVNSDSLTAKLLKAKYFPRSDLLHADLKPSCSFTWRSIWSSISLLKQGCRKLIGDGRSTEIWGDPWLPGNSQFFVQSPRPDGCPLHYVSDLINEETHSWRRELVLEIFNPYEASLILSIPLSWGPCEDGWTWNFTRNGIFSVRSGYHRAVETGNNFDGPSSSSMAFRGACLWSLDIPEKVHLLLWQAYKNVLPTKDNLRRRRVDVDVECPVCGLEPESVLHCFMSCPAVRAAWLGCPLSLRVMELNVDSFADFFDCVRGVLDKAELEFFCVLCWRIWGCWNDMVWHGKCTNPRQVIEHSQQFLHEYRRVMALKGQGAVGAPRHCEICWKPPNAGFVKINIDGAISTEQRTFGMGAIARGCSGEVVAAMACKGHGAVAAEIAGACSLRQALQWARDLSLTTIVVESDCACLITALNSESLNRNSSLGAVLTDCKLLTISFLACRFQHVRRTGNSVAHELAKRALHAEADEYWMEVVPEDIARIVAGDTLNISSV